MVRRSRTRARSITRRSCGSNNALNTEQVERLGLSHFKRSVNQNYYQLAADQPWRQPDAARTGHWMQRPTFAPFRSRMDVPSSSKGLRGSGPGVLGTPALFIAFRRAALGPGDARRCAGPARQGRRPRGGRPTPHPSPGPAYFTGSRQFGAEAIGSSRICRRLDAPPVVAELGAGYGRTRVVLARALSSRYWVFDIRRRYSSPSGICRTCFRAAYLHLPPVPRLEVVRASQAPVRAL